MKRGRPSGRQGRVKQTTTARSTAAEQASLLRACAAGDRVALERLYRGTSPQLYGLALRIVVRRDLAEEVLQEAFLSAWRHSRSFDEQRGSALAWLAGIVRNQAIDLLRRRREVGVDPGALPERVDPGAGPFDLAALSEESRALKRCLDELEESPRRSVLLAYFEGLTFEEVAARMKAPIGTVKSWVRRSLMRLRSCLER